MDQKTPEQQDSSWVLETGLAFDHQERKEKISSVVKHVKKDKVPRDPSPRSLSPTFKHALVSLPGSPGHWTIPVTNDHSVHPLLSLLLSLTIPFLAVSRAIWKLIGKPFL